MKTLLVGLNAKYIHSNLAIHSISKYAAKKGVEIEPVEYTINQDMDYIMADIYNKKPDAIGFSCYIWNIEIVEKLVMELGKIIKNCFIFLGGPEVSFEMEYWFEKLPAIDAISYGEGESSVTNMIKALSGEGGLSEVKGISYRSDKVVINAPVEPLEMDDLPFVYEEGFATYTNRILYYETSRGCPFNCQYCLSSVERGVRFRSLERVYKELLYFLSHEVRQVKFVDRTFNCNKKRTKALWQFIIDHDNGITNFHFEIAADLLDDAILEVLKKARPGLIQLEIGVQSTHEPTLDIIKRVTDFEAIKHRVKHIQSFHNTHIHLDLIAGLPKESFDIFRKSFNDVYQLYPDQLQLGFLKVLRGSGMKSMAEVYGLVYRDYAPYEILETNHISYEEMESLKIVEHVLELYYNSGYYKRSLRFLCRYFDTPFDMYNALGHLFKENGGHMIKHAKLALYEMLRTFGIGVHKMNVTALEGCLTYDLMLQEKIKKYPEWIEQQKEYQQFIRRFFEKEALVNHYIPQLKGYTSKQLSRMCHIHVYSGETLSYINNRPYENEQIMVLYDYSQRDPLNNEPMQLELKHKDIEVWLEAE